MRMSPDEESIRCTVFSCSCVGFKPGKAKCRSCDRCGHGWVMHALQKLQAQSPSSSAPAEVALPGPVLDLSSLVLYGAQAVPVRLKILLDRLYSVLAPEQVGRILHTLGWSLGDYVRGYMLQFPGGKVLDRWVMVTPEEELLVLEQFLRFGETRPIVELMTPEFPSATSHHSNPDPDRSNASSLTECKANVLRIVREEPSLEADREESSLLGCNKTVNQYGSLPGRLSFLLPFQFPGSTFQNLAPPHKDLVPPSRQTKNPQEPSDTRPTQKYRPGGDKSAQENDQILPDSRKVPVLKIKVDPDEPNLSHWLFHQNVHTKDGLEQKRGVAPSQEPTSLGSPSFIPVSPSIHLSISSSTVSPTKNFPKLHGFSSPSSFHPLPSFSSSFSSSLNPPTCSPCSLPSPAGGRKGRVCCAVCGKSFYDKGTLKIHYNAVHLKIKHRCTVAGCTMVFSSLRSRNRHSANPNPRLHTDASSHRNASDPCKPDNEACGLTSVHQHREGVNGHTNSNRDNMHVQAPTSPLQPSSGYKTYRSILQVLPLPPPPDASPSVVPHVAPVVEKTQHLVSFNTIDTEPATLLWDNPVGSPGDCIIGKQGTPTNQHQRHQQQWESCDCIPKKKPRKSRTPVKIRREEVKGRSNKKEEEL